MMVGEPGLKTITTHYSLSDMSAQQLSSQSVEFFPRYVISVLCLFVYFTINLPMMNEGISNISRLKDSQIDCQSCLGPAQKRSWIKIISDLAVLVWTVGEWEPVRPVTVVLTTNQNIGVFQAEDNISVLRIECT